MRSLLGLAPHRLLAVGVSMTMLLSLSACAASGDEPVGQNYVSGDGTVTEFDVLDRGEPIDFSGTTDLGETVTSDEYRGGVVVVNFWYASCPPCRMEAPDLQALNEEFANDEVQFLGVNLRDGADTSLTFAKKFGISYPSIVDTDGQVALAFTGTASPAAVPTTVVLDRSGRPASRIVGLLDKSTLRALIQTALAEVAR